MRDATWGVLAIVLANLIWGFSPILYKVLDHIPPLEVLSHRTIWSLAFFGVVLAFQGRIRAFLGAFVGVKAASLTLLAAVTITINWCLFIWAIQVERAVEASLGYYIFPLLSVLLGWLVFGEAMGRVKVLAFALAAVAVVVLTYGSGTAPMVSLVLATSFSVYVVLKKLTTLGPVVSVTAEVALLVPFALIWLWGVHFQGWTGITGQNFAAFGGSSTDTILLILSGPLTAGPLILFSFASRRLNLATVGLLQYINPTLQFLVAVAIFAEPFTKWHGMAFPMIWLALAIYSVAAIGQDRAARKLATKAGTSSTTVTKSISDASAKPSPMT